MTDLTRNAQRSQTRFPIHRHAAAQRGAQGERNLGADAATAAKFQRAHAR